MRPILFSNSGNYVKFNDVFVPVSGFSPRLCVAQ